MCGIFAAFGPGAKNHEVNRTAAALIKHRGPDYTGEYISPDGLVYMCHHRLAIVHPKSGAQPIINEYEYDGKLCREILAINGEIYNYRELNEELKLGFDLNRSHSDCDVMNPIMRNFTGCLPKINGMFGLVYYNEHDGRFIFARDYIGIIPLYFVRGSDGTLYVSSEIKALSALDIADHSIQVCPPNSVHIARSSTLDSIIMKHDYDDCNVADVKGSTTPKATFDNLAAAVKSHMATEVKMAVLLSGGLDSSIIAALAKSYSSSSIDLHTYSVGLAGSPDLKAARVMSEYLGSIHHEVIFTIAEGLAYLPEAVRRLETYDITTIRAGLPMLLMMRQIAADGFKVVLSGEGSDELWAGYAYNAKAPNSGELYYESVRKMNDLHWYDCRRANMAGAAYGVEVRVPFLDRSVVDYVMSLDPGIKMHSTMRLIDDRGDVHRQVMEKRHLREAFEGYLPASILWRKKEQFSDGVGYQWITVLKAADMQDEKDNIVINTPLSSEGFKYRRIFDSHFNKKASYCCPNQKSVACSSPIALEWDKAWKDKHDPSGRI